MKVLALMDYVARTGFGTVSKNIVAELKKHFGATLQLDIIAINYFGEPYYEDDNTFIVSGKRMDGEADDFGRFFFLKMLSESNEYDGIFICQDLGVVVPFIEHLEFIKKNKRETNSKSFKSIFYFPIDTHIIRDLTKNLEFFDLIVTYTNFGKQEILKFKPELKTKIKIIPHGNNSKDFYPLSEEERLKFRKEYFGDNADKFIVTSVNRNQPRKDIPSTIFGFIEAKNAFESEDAKLPTPFLYLHMHPNDPMGWDLRGILLQTDLIEDVDYKLLPKEFEDTMCDIKTLNAIYNASDVCLTTTLGEGWGFIFSEAAACKLPIIAPYTTSFMEMSNYGQNAYMLTTIYPCCSPTDNIIREQTDIYEVGERILEIARDKITPLNSAYAYTLQRKIDDSYAWVKTLEWSEVCKQWIKYFKETY